MKSLKQKPPDTPKKTKYIVKDVFKEPDQAKRNQKVLEIMKKQIKQKKTVATTPTKTTVTSQKRKVD